MLVHFLAREGVMKMSMQLERVSVPNEVPKAFPEKGPEVDGDNDGNCGDAW